MAYAPDTLAERRGNRPKVEREEIPANPTGFADLVDELDAIAADAKHDPALARFLGSSLTLAKAKAIATKATKPIEIFRKGGTDALAWLAVAQHRVGAPPAVTMTKHDIKIEPRHGGGWWGTTKIARGLLSVAPIVIIGDGMAWTACPTEKGPIVVTGDLELQGMTMFGELRVLGTLRVRYINGGGTIVLGAGGYTLSKTASIVADATLRVGEHANVPAQGVHPNQLED